jgi:hypothetical protein
MRRVAIAILLSSLACAAQAVPPQHNSLTGSRAGSDSSNSRIVVPSGTAVVLALTRAVLARTAKPGDSIYAETVFPVAINNRMAIPPGTYIEGQIDFFTKPSWRSPYAHFQIHFTKIIFATGYTVQLPGARNGVNAEAPAQNVSAVASAPSGAGGDVLAAVANTYVQVSPASDVLLDNGTQIEMTLQIPLRLSAASVAEAARRANPASLPQFKSATQCRPTPGTPGTSDTVIPGTSGTPGTPDIVIPGGPGTPDTVIPGIPATQGTPATVIPSSPSTPGVSCPGPPLATSDPKPQKYNETIQIAKPVQIWGKVLPAGVYQVAWEGQGPSAAVDFLQNGKIAASAQARVVFLSDKSSADVPGTRANSDGSLVLRSLRFAGQAFALYFSQVAP